MNRYKIKIFLAVLAVSYFSILAPAQKKDSHVKDSHAIHWSYAGKTGPEHWSELNPAYKLCNGGSEQSPIDLDNAKLVDLKNLIFTYKRQPINLINNGHTIQENIIKGSVVVINGKTYQLLQFHFHTPSEHTINGYHYPLEMHLVNQNGYDEIAVVGVFFKVGRPNKELQKIIDNLPRQINKEEVNNSVILNLENLMPTNRNYFHYTGSLTTPPCSENINWNIFKTPVEASAQQLSKLKLIMGNNSRPVQKLNSRIVYESK